MCAPTVEIRTSVFSKLASGRWVWLPAGDDFPNTKEDVRSSAELSRALYVYATTTARLMAPQVAPHGFRLTAHSGGVTIGMHIWLVSSETQRFIPSGPPWVLMDTCSLTPQREHNYR